MTVLVSKPALNIREELSSLKKPSGPKGEELLRANTIADVFRSITPISRRNRVDNGDFSVNQRKVTSYTVSGNASTITGAPMGYVADRWKSHIGTAQYSTTQPNITVARTNNAASIGFPWCASWTVNSAGVGGTNRDMSFLNQFIENGNLQDLRWGTPYAKPFTISFWVRSAIEL